MFLVFLCRLFLLFFFFDQVRKVFGFCLVGGFLLAFGGYFVVCLVRL